MCHGNGVSSLNFTVFFIFFFFKRTYYLFILLLHFFYFFIFGKLVWEVADSPRVVGDAERAVFVGVH